MVLGCVDLWFVGSAFGLCMVIEVRLFGCVVFAVGACGGHLVIGEALGTSCIVGQLFFLGIAQ